MALSQLESHLRYMVVFGDLSIFHLSCSILSNSKVENGVIVVQPHSEQHEVIR